MTLFGIIWKAMQETGEAPRESYFAETHSPAWYSARELCRQRVALAKAEGR